MVELTTRPHDAAPAASSARGAEHVILQAGPNAYILRALGVFSNSVKSVDHSDDPLTLYVESLQTLWKSITAPSPSQHEPAASEKRFIQTLMHLDEAVPIYWLSRALQYVIHTEQEVNKDEKHTVRSRELVNKCIKLIGNHRELTGIGAPSHVNVSFSHSASSSDIPQLIVKEFNEATFTTEDAMNLLSATEYGSTLWGASARVQILTAMNEVGLSLSRLQRNGLICGRLLTTIMV